MRLRNQREMQQDPRFAFMVGRLVGSAETASLLLVDQSVDRQHLATVGARLDVIARWFLEPDDDRAITKVLKP